MIKGILFDYGGTIDTNGLHWGSVLWDHYQKYQVPVSKEHFSKAYSFGERALAINPLVKPEHNFYDVLYLKIEQQFNYLTDNGFKPDYDLVKVIASDCNLFAQSTIEQAKPTLDELFNQYPMAMVSNFYGNLNAVLESFGISKYFGKVVESAVVGVRKPDPAIYQLGVDFLNFPAAECVVIGDSYSKDIIPAKTIGCKAIWLNVKGWEEPVKNGGSFSEADAEISDFKELANKIGSLAPEQIPG